MRGRSRTEIETLVGGYESVEMFSYSTYNPDNPIHYEYECTKDNVSFYFQNDEKIEKVKIHDPSNMVNPEKAFIIEVLGIRVGDDEQKLRRKFPGSTKYIDAMRRYFRDQDGKYSASVKLIDNHGWVTYHLNEGKVTDIELAFQYWD